ncbi:hypothetical protein GCM10011487_12360 [Steroidobacter agaridevorans]|uniref:TNase-like domain-containing protein n=1 Tax=Steroidobacter agaridevorans TaxID=2695856 RepID=A0A829Y905_9GAMM|nr:MULTISPECIES: thermonuclease family protein [Steroidobacteraceae]GFE79236.1 hypothetical protein GCM10011487_12360 [Steroidobacter agaridevorans]GFE87278.1 hypothetical protein GCM10011488_22320 [Steroidobacter agaridevorans]
MKSILWVLALTAATLFAHSTAALSEGRSVLAGRVVKVIDGDTIDVRLQSGLIRVRFHGVDAPENAQNHGKEATAALSLLVMDKDVQIEPFEQDRYDRLVGIVFIGELNVNSAAVRNGHAWAMRRYMRKADAVLVPL